MSDLSSCVPCESCSPWYIVAWYSSKHSSSYIIRDITATMTGPGNHVIGTANPMGVQSCLLLATYSQLAASSSAQQTRKAQAESSNPSRLLFTAISLFGLPKYIWRYNVLTRSLISAGNKCKVSILCVRKLAGSHLHRHGKYRGGEHNTRCRAKAQSHRVTFNVHSSGLFTSSFFFARPCEHRGPRWRVVARARKGI